MTPGTSSPPSRQPTAHVYYSMTKSLCGVCKTAVDAKIVFRDDRVYFDKFCPTHGQQECLVASSVEWYLDCLAFVAPHRPPKQTRTPVAAGCPFDCGPCASHQQKVYLPVIPITSACNLDCPICYTVNKNEDAHRLSAEALRLILDHLLQDHEELDIINFTGGEPTLHPELPEFLEMCRQAGIRRLTISTNGLKLRDEAYVRKLAALDARIVLSLDTFRPETDKALLGANTVAAKLKALELLEKHDVATTILPAVAMGLNDDEVGALFDLVVSRPHIRSLELHTLTFTGQGGVGFARSARITIPDLHRRLEAATGGRLQWRDFVPSPLAHPHCYSICYILCLDGGGFVPFTRLTSRAQLYELLQDSLYIEPRERLEEVFRGIIDDLWADPGGVPESGAVLGTLRRLLDEMFPPGRPPLSILERQKIAERSAKAIYIHSHMDEESFDVARVMKCCVGVPEVDGSNIPTCSYNVLYRERDTRFADPQMLRRMAAARPARAPEVVRP
jgi:7,8-dihydro-6-hydroxymethylpterin dimethyltransferase